MARRPADYTAQMQAAEERRRQQQEKQREQEQRAQRLRDRQAANYGLVVLDILGPRITIDTLTGLLLEAHDRAKANPVHTARWATRGADHFRPAGATGRRQPAQSDGATGNGAELGSEHSDQPTELEREPPRPRTTAPAGTADLLNGLALDRAEPGAQEEGGSRGQRA